MGTSGKNRYAVFYTALDIMVSDGNDHLSAFAAGIRHKKQAASGGLSAFIDGAKLLQQDDRVAVTENFMAMSRIMNFLPFFLAGYYEKDGGFFLHYGKQRNPKEAKIATMFLAVGIIAGFILVSRVSTRKLFWGTESFNGGVYTWYTRILAWIIAF